MRITATEQLGEGGCSPSLESDDTPKEGQVWELCYSERLEPCLLLHLYVGKFGREDQDYWRCLSLESGKLFSATTMRWDPTYFGHQLREHDDDVPLIGRRLL